MAGFLFAKSAAGQIRASYRARPEVKEREQEYAKKLYRTDSAYRSALRRNSRKPERVKKKSKYGAEYRERNRARIANYNKEYASRPHVVARKREQSRRRDALRKSLGYPHRKAESYKAALRLWNAARRKNTRVRLHRRISTAIRLSLKAAKNGNAWEALLGFTCAELMSHIERQFSPGMTWQNMGLWHIDHIRPVSSFVFSSAEDVGFKQCWALHNLRPLWAAENIQKRYRREFLI